MCYLSACTISQETSLLMISITSSFLISEKLKKFLFLKNQKYEKALSSSRQSNQHRTHKKHWITICSLKTAPDSIFSSPISRPSTFKMPIQEELIIHCLRNNTNRIASNIIIILCCQRLSIIIHLILLTIKRFYSHSNNSRSFLFHQL